MRLMTKGASAVRVGVERVEQTVERIGKGDMGLSVSLTAAPAMGSRRGWFRRPIVTVETLRPAAQPERTGPCGTLALRPAP
jgi:hypothetical protein